MAAIPTVNSQIVQAKRLRAATAQATTGQTDWVAVPPWAQYAQIIVNVTATAGTTPILLAHLKIADPITKDDTNTTALITTTGGITSTGQAVIDVGPGVTGIADTVALAATGARMTVNASLPSLLGVQVLNDRTTGDETYTYTVTTVFRGGAA